MIGQKFSRYLMRLKLGDAEAFYCPISWVELLCYPALTEEQANEMRDFLRLLNCVSLTELVLDSAAQIRRDYRLKLGDGVIAACALVEGCVLVTRNAKDFKRVNGLTILQYGLLKGWEALKY